MAFPELTDRLFHLLRIKRSGQPATTIEMDRCLTDEERELIEWLLRHGEPNAADCLSQVDTIRVRGGCSCGCPSIQLTVPQTTPTVISTDRTLAEFIGTVDRETVGVILGQAWGRLVGLEIWAY
jgi:hypothetical protein